MIKFLYIRFCLYSFLFIFMGCSAMPGELKTAERLLETSPDSAYHILQHIKHGLLITHSDRALYALLMSQALDKNNIKVESDSLIAIATDYYNDKDPVHAAYAWFYRARCANTRGNANIQASYLFIAQDFAEKTEDNRLRGLVYVDKGIMYQTQGKIDSSFSYFNRAYQSFKKNRDDRNCVLCLINAGDECVYASRGKCAIAYFLLAEKIAKNTQDTVILSTVYRNLGTGYFKRKDYSTALHYFHLAPLTHIAIYDSNKWYLLADVFIKTERFDSASYYLDKVTQLQEMAPDYYRLWEVLYEKVGNSHKALYYANRVITSKDSLYKRKLDVSFAGLEKKYKYQGLQLENKNLIIKGKQNNILLLIAMFVLSMGVIVILTWRYKIKNHQFKIQQQLLKQEHDLKVKEKENNLLLERQIKMQNILLSNVEQYRTHSVKRATSTTQGKMMISPILNLTFHEELIASVDIQYHDISKRLNERIPELTERDILICCLLLANFDTGMIATILDVKLDSITTHRHRLRTKLKMKNSDNLMDYLMNF